MRLFVAIMPSPAIVGHIQRLRAPLMARAPEAHWARPESWHWTLQFLGERPEAELPALTAALAQVRQPAFALELRGLGGFPAAGRLRTLWIGVADPAPLLAASQAASRALAALGRAPAAQPPFFGRSRWSLRLGFHGLPSRQRRMLGRDGRQRTPAGAPGVSKLPREEQPYTPHLTLARAGPRGAGLAPLRAALSPAEPVWGRQTAESFTLFWSRPRQGVFQYVALASFPLRP